MTANNKLTESQTSLQQFLDAFNDAQPELKWIRDEFRFRYEMETGSLDTFGNHHNNDDNNRYKRNSKNSMKSAKKNYSDNGDTWYNDFRRKECHLNEKSNKSYYKKDFDKGTDEEKVNEPLEFPSSIDDQMDKKLKLRGFMKSSKETQPKFENLNLEARYNARKYLAQDKDSVKNIETNWRRISSSLIEQQDQQDDSNVHLTKRSTTVNNEMADKVHLDDQISNKKNDLSHEANYKLSKKEQEHEMEENDGNLVGKQQQQTTMETITGELKYRSRQDEQNGIEQEQEDDEKNGKSQFHLIKSKSKRDINPLHEIKLKISNKMIAKGLGAQLPSDMVYANDVELWPMKSMRPSMIPDSTQLSQQNPIPNYNVFKRDLTDIVERNELKIDDNGKISNNETGIGHLIGILKETLTIPAPRYKGENNKKSNINKSFDYDYNGIENNVKNFNYDLSGKDEHNDNDGDDDESNNNSEKTNKEQQENKSTDKKHEQQELVKIQTFKNQNEKLNQEIGEKSAENEKKFQDNLCKLKNDFVLSDGNNNSNSKKKNATVINVGSQQQKVADTNKLIDINLNLKFQMSDANLTDNKSSGIHKRNVLRERRGKPNTMDDLISGNLPNQIVKGVHDLLNANEKLRKYVKPFLVEPNYDKLNNPSKINAIKSDEMMKDLVGSINELVEDQIHMRTCIPLTPELKKFYNDLMGQQIYAEDVEDEDYDVEEDVEDFLTPHKRYSRNIQFVTVDDKYSLIYSLMNRLNEIMPIEPNLQHSIRKYLTDHLDLLDAIKMFERSTRSRRDSNDKQSMKLSTAYTKLIGLENYMMEENVESF